MISLNIGRLTWVNFMEMLIRDIIEDKMENTEDIITTFESPESTTIKGADYDKDTHTLYVRFTNGKTYRGQDFPEKAWEEFVQAGSKGAHFNRRIRPLYILKQT